MIRQSFTLALWVCGAALVAFVAAGVISAVLVAVLVAIGGVL